MTLRTIVPSLLIGALLASCSGGGSTSSAPSSALPQTQGPASGTISISVPASNASSNAGKRPQYISSAATNAYYSIDTGPSQGMTCSGGPPVSCSAAFTVSAGTHTFNAEIWENHNYVILAEGQATASVSAGSGNAIAITLAGVAATVVFPSVNCAGSTCNGGGTALSGVAVTDFDGVNITTPPAFFDDGTLTITGVTESPYNGNCSGLCRGDTVTFGGGSSTLSAVSGTGYYAWAATCNDANSQFYVTSITAQYPNGPNSGAPYIPPGGPPGGASYPPIGSGLSVTYYTYLCDGNENISQGALGTVTINSSGRHT